MTPDTDKREWLGEWIYAKFVQNYEKLLEENRKLKEEREIRALNDRDNLIQIEKLEKENKKLKGENEYRKTIVDVVPEWEGHIAEETIQDLQARIKELKEENEELKEAMKELNNYNKFRIQENKKLKELQICWKTVAERIEEDKKVVRMDTSCMEEDTLQELKDLGEI